MRLAREVVDLTERTPMGRHRFFRDQVCSAALSVAANIAEGNGRGTPLDYAAFLDRARGSLFELDTWLVFAFERDWLPAEDFRRIEHDIEMISLMINSLARSLRRKPALDSRNNPST